MWLYKIQTQCFIIYKKENIYLHVLIFFFIAGISCQNLSLYGVFPCSRLVTSKNLDQICAFKERCLEFCFCRGSNQIPYPACAVFSCGHHIQPVDSLKKRNSSFMHMHHIIVRAGSGLHCEEQRSQVAAQKPGTMMLPEDTQAQ